MNEKIDEYLQCLHERRYYDAHEALEEIWFPRRFEKDDEMYLLKGFINAAVSFELVKRGRQEASKRAYANYLKYITKMQCINSIHMPRYKEMQKIVEDKYNYYHHVSNL